MPTISQAPPTVAGVLQKLLLALSNYTVRDASYANLNLRQDLQEIEPMVQALHDSHVEFERTVAYDLPPQPDDWHELDEAARILTPEVVERAVSALHDAVTELEYIMGPLRISVDAHQPSPEAISQLANTEGFVPKVSRDTTHHVTGWYEYRSPRLTAAGSRVDMAAFVRYDPTYDPANETAPGEWRVWYLPEPHPWIGYVSDAAYTNNEHGTWSFIG